MNNIQDIDKQYSMEQLYANVKEILATARKRAYSAVRHELTWSHYRRLISVEDEKARLWYMNEGKQLFASRYKLYLPTEEFKHMLESIE